MGFFQTAEGTLTLGGKATLLKFAYAFECADDASDPPRKLLRLLLTDQPVAMKAREGTQGRYPLQQDGKLAGVEFEFHKPDPAENFSGLVYPPRPRAVSSFTIKGKKHFTELKIADGVIEGKVTSEATASARYEATFRARISLLPPLKKIVTGEEAQSHPLVALLKRYFAAAHKADYSAMRELASKETLASWDRQEEKLGTTASLRDLREFGKFVQFDPRTVTRIVVRAERATVITTPSDGNSDLTELHREGILWKVHIP
ncbi:hypothetical protein [Armatimonas sp.]|uniref:hypothetical protein n=1 Tax=Armatimonas sp. TaxID=1872638 RepID=UPI003750CF0A